MSRNSKKFRGMSQEERFIFMATANRVTVASVWQVDETETPKSLRRSFVAKVRGIIVSDGETFQFETEEEAFKFGTDILAGWKRELAERAAA